MKICLAFLGLPLACLARSLETVLPWGSILADHVRMQRRQETITCDTLCRGCIEVDVYFHVLGFNVTNLEGQNVTVVPYPARTAVEYFELLDEGGESPLDPEEFFLPERLLAGALEAQMEVLNNAFKDTPFRFRYANQGTETLTDEIVWSQNPLLHTEDIKDAIGNNDLKILDVFIAPWLGFDKPSLNSTSLTLGLAAFPSYQNQFLIDDGVYLFSGTLPVPGAPSFSINTGITLAHEVGHWLGLYHVFHAAQAEALNLDPCDPRFPGDFVDDTPTVAGSFQASDEDTSIESCDLDPSLIDSCPGLPGTDPIYNIMNYIRDRRCVFDDNGELIGGFTCGQVIRMFQQWHEYRDHVTSCPEGEMEVEIFYQFGSDFNQDNSTLKLRNTDTSVLVYDSTSIDTRLVFLGFQQTLLVDLCLPQANYEFTISDGGGDGISSEGYVEIRVNGVILQTVQGDFGHMATVTIPNPLDIDPTQPPTDNDPTEPPMTTNPTVSPTHDSSSTGGSCFSVLLLFLLSALPFSLI